jgi:peptidoglycan/LPS O-acetylase OafA/YrhL
MAAHHRINIEIEYLRAVAILLVIFAHLPVILPGWDFGQWTGVDLFFCISGYVISRSFEAEFDGAISEGRGFWTALAFWTRRLFRLAPSAWLWLSINVFCSWAYNFSGAFLGTPAQNLADAVSFLSFSTNFALAGGGMHSNRFFWSLTLEDQFYFLFPIFLLLVRSRWRWAVLILFIVLQAIPDRSLGTKLFPPYLWTTRLDALMWGCLIYQFSRSNLYWKLEPIFYRYRIIAPAISAVLIGCLIEIPKDAFEFVVGHKIESFVALTSAALVFLASFDRGYALPLPSFIGRIFAWIGARSYGLYLIHIPLMSMIGETQFRLGISSHVSAALAFFITLPIIAELNFRFVETPMRQVGSRLAQRMKGGLRMPRGQTTASRNT